MTLELVPNKTLLFYGPFNEKLSSMLTLKNLHQSNTVAVVFSSNVYHARISVKPKKALVSPNGEITVTFKYQPSRPQVNC